MIYKVEKLKDNKEMYKFNKIQETFKRKTSQTFSKLGNLVQKFDRVLRIKH